MNAVNGQVAFGTGGNFFFGPQIRVLAPANAIQALGIGAGAANIPTAGFIRVPYNASDTEPILAVVNSVGLNNVPLLSFGPTGTNVYVVGGAGIRETLYMGATGGAHRFGVAGVVELSVGATAMGLHNNALIGVEFVEFGTPGGPAAGLMRAKNDLQIVVAKNAGGFDTELLAFDSANGLLIGRGAAGPTTGQVLNLALYVGSGGQIFHRIDNAEELTISSTTANFHLNSQSNVGGIAIPTGAITFGSGPSAQGKVRFRASAGEEGVWWRNFGNTQDIPGLFLGTDDVLYMGDGTNTAGFNLRSSTFLNIIFGSNAEWAFSSSALNASQNDVNSVRRVNNLDNIKQYGNLPDSNAELVGQSGPQFFIPSSVSATRTYVAIPTMAVYSDVIFIDNRSGFTCVINQSGTGMGTPSGTIGALPPTMGAQLTFGSGYWELGGRYRLSAGYASS